MTEQMKSDIKFTAWTIIAIIVCTMLSGCASLRDYSEWKMQKEQGCAVCCPPAFGNAFAEDK